MLLHPIHSTCDVCHICAVCTDPMDSTGQTLDFACVVCGCWCCLGLQDSRVLVSVPGLWLALLGDPGTPVSNTVQHSQCNLHSSNPFASVCIILQVRVQQRFAGLCSVCRH